MQIRRLTVVANLRGFSLTTRFSIMLLTVLFPCSLRALGSDGHAPFYNWRFGDFSYEAADPAALDIQVQALMSGDRRILEQLDKLDNQKLTKVIKVITGLSIVPLESDGSTFTPEAAAAFGIIIQHGSSQLIQDGRYEKEADVRASGYKAQAIVRFIIGTQKVSIVIEAIQKALAAFCPMYPFCK
jgi:hypothetical protein